MFTGYHLGKMGGYAQCFWELGVEQLENGVDF